MPALTASSPAVLLVIALASPAVHADPIDDDAPAASVTSTTLTRAEIDRRPHQSATDLLRHVAGLTALAQGGRADNYLVRGFEAGADNVLNVMVDGVPINLGSHAFVNGYADTHFVIADSVERISLYEGAYAARYGSSAVAGTLDITTIDKVPGGAAVRISSGTEYTDQLLPGRLKRLRYRLTGMFSPELKTGSALLAAEVGIDDGPYVHPQRFRRGLVLAKWKRPVGDDGVVAAMVQFYSGRWFDSGYLPAASVDAGRLTPYSAADATQGGIAQRTSASLSYEVTDDKRATWHVGMYLVDSDLRLYSNPSLFRDDTEDGDQIEYVDKRAYYGLDAFWRRPHTWGPLRGHVRFGVQARADHTEAATWHDERRLRLETCGVAVNPCTDTAPQTRVVSAYGEDTLQLWRIRAQSGIRLDQESWNVDDRDADTMLGKTSLGGTGARARLSPRLAVSYLGDAIDLVAAGNFGSLSTDARASVDRSGYGAFIRTRGAEVGTKLHPTEQIAGSLAWWWSQVDEHQVWVAAEGRGYRADRANRRGIEAKVVFAPTRWLAFDAAVAIARGSTRPDRSGPHAPLALLPRSMGNGGVSLARGASFASLRIRSLGIRQTTDVTRPAKGWTVLDAVAGTKWRDFELTLTIDNLTDERWREAQYAADVRTSRTVEVTHDLLTAIGTPLTVSLTLGWTPR